VAVAGVLFVLSGIGITLEAWSKTTGSSIDPTLDKFIVEAIEPNFTTGLLILLGFSVSLGLFAAAQLGSAGAQYKEDE
jgi:ABC-type dipeptide/oligopeptide/nickel transport system permease component